MQKYCVTFWLFLPFDNAAHYKELSQVVLISIKYFC